MVQYERRFNWPKRASVLIMCFLATFVCFLDRVNISVAAVAMQKELGWSDSTKGLMLASFFVGYLIFQIPSGWLASKYGGRKVMAVAIIWWSVFTMLTPLAAMMSLPLLLLARFGMGLGEGAAFPAAYNLGARWFPPAERSRFVGVLLTGIPVGTMFALLTTGFIIEAAGWQSVFYLFGILGIIIGLVWLAVVKDSPDDHPHISAQERALLADTRISKTAESRTVPWRLLLSKPPVWALIFNHFCSNWILYVLLTWLPSYFSQVQNLSLVDAGIFSAAPWLAMIICGNAASAFADSLIRRGVDVNLVRKTFQATALTGAATALLLVRGVTDPTSAMALMCLALGALGLSWAGFSPNHLEIAPEYADVLVGRSNTAGSLPGAVGVAITGWLVDRTGSFDMPFFASACIAAAGAIVWLMFSTARRLDLPQQTKI